jgi:Ca-activated chloride channel homolog
LGIVLNLARRHMRSFQKKLIALPFALMACVPLGCGITWSQAQKPVFQVEVDLQSVDVQVKDAHGNDVMGLTAKDFTVLENGKPQKIAFFDAGIGPVSLAVLVDSSTSMITHGRLGSAQAIAAQFMHTAHRGDEIFAMDFTDQMGPFQRITQEQLLGPSGPDLALAASGGAALYDAIATALCHLRASKNLRQSVVVITDGDDQHSRITLDQLIGLVHSSRAQVFMIGLQSRPNFNFQGRSEPKITLITGHEIDNPVVVFDRLMKESGAESFIPNSQRGLDEALTAVSNMLQSEYTLAYYPQKTSKKFRRIEVNVDRRGAHAMARHYVEANQVDNQLVRFDESTCIVAPKFHPYPFESKLTEGSTGTVYRDDFSDRRGGWPNHQDSHYILGGYELSNYKVQAKSDGQLAASGFPVESPAHTTTFLENIIAAYGPWWSDFRASVATDAVLETVSRKTSTEFLQKNRPAAGLVFRMNLNGCYALLMSRVIDRKKLSVELVRRDFEGDSYKETEIVPWTEVAPNPSAPTTELSVEVVGDRISMFVDSQEVTTARDDAFSQGLVGFIISGPGRATFRDLVVEQR